MWILHHRGLPPGATRCGAVMLAWVALAWGLPIQAADTPDETARAGHQETLEDLPAGAAAERSAAVSTRAVVAVGPYISVQVNVDALGDNILGDAANEPSIAIDATDPARMVIGWRQFDSVLSNFRQAGRAYTQDGGWTWTNPGVFEPGIFRSDPVLDYDADGNIYYNSLRSDFTCQYFISGDGGVNWTTALPAFGGDKLWSAIDRTSGIGRGNIYCAWSPAAGCCGNRLFTRSTTGGFSFMEPMALPVQSTWGTLCVAPNGNLLICSRAVSGSSAVQISFNAQDPNATPTFPVTRLVAMGGSTSFSSFPNPAGLLGQMWIACEPPGGPRPNHVYLLGSVNPPGADPLDVMFARSTDGGFNWEPPLRINDDPLGRNAYQWFGTMAVAPNGRIDAVWNDTRNDPTNQFSELFYASSSDGGLTWTENVAVSPPFNPSLGYPNQNKLGDYYDIISADGAVHVAYAATFNGEQDVYYLRIPIDCNLNGVLDEQDIAAGTSVDCDSNGLPDECDRDCNTNGQVDACEVSAGSAPDCDGNSVPDVCDIATGAQPDCDASGVPDGCELAAGTAPDCDTNGVPDACDIAAAVAEDCNGDGVPDACNQIELAATISPPTDTIACTQAPASFTIAAPDATGYQWLFEDVEIPNAQAATLTVDPVSLADEGAYHCRVSFGCVSAESPAAILRVVPPSVEIELLSSGQLAACDGSVAVLQVGLNDADGGLYQWSRDGIDLTNGGRIAGAQTATLEIDDVRHGDAGTYTCRAWNICLDEAEAVSTAGIVTVITPEFVQPPASVCADLGTDAAISAQIVSDLPFGQAWYEGTTPLTNGGRISGAQTPTLQIADVQPADAGRRFRLLAAVLNPPCTAFSDEAVLTVQQAGGCANCPQPGDLDADGDYDLVDMAAFGTCFGADVGQAPVCACANVDGTNAQVDLADWELLEQLIAGPGGG
jgi:hypothetical protein